MELGVFLPVLIAKMAMNPKIRWDGVPKLNHQTLSKIIADPESGRIEVHVKVRWLKMSRRRFERMLMAIGVHARDAKEMADMARAKGCPYNEAFDVICKMAIGQVDEEQETEAEEELEEETDE